MVRPESLPVAAARADGAFAKGPGTMRVSNWRDVPHPWRWAAGSDPAAKPKAAVRESVNNIGERRIVKYPEISGAIR